VVASAGEGGSDATTHRRQLGPEASLERELAAPARVTGG
jgi:hypothetical protein